MSKCVYFDLDGTLTDSGEGIMNCAAKTLMEFGITPPDAEGLRAFVGPPLRDSFPEYGVPEDRVEEAVATYRRFYVPDGMFQNHPSPGIYALLSKLKNAGYRLFVATSKPEFMAQAILEKFELRDYFEDVCGAVLNGNRDSKEQILDELHRRYPDITEAVMVGDTVYDILGAAAHNLPAIGVSWGFGTVSEMQEAGAAAIAYTMDELYDLITKEGA